MMVIGIVIAFLCGWVWCTKWENRRVRQYVRQLNNAMMFCDMMRDTNELLTKKIERMEKLGIVEDENSLQCQIDQGVLNAMEYMKSRVERH